MRCRRCNGLMVDEQFEDLGALGPGDQESVGWRCVNCGAIVDPVIVENRRLTLQATTLIHALTAG